MFKEGKKDAKSLPIDERIKLLKELRIKSEDYQDVKNIIFNTLEKQKIFKSILEEVNYITGFLTGLSYVTKNDIEKDINEIMKKLNIYDMKAEINNYYIVFGQYQDKRYNKIRYKIYLTPKKGTLSKPTSRIPKEKDPRVINELIDKLRDYLEILDKIEDRKLKIFTELF